MDTDELYLNYLADKQQSLLLTHTEDTMNVHYSGLNVEPMFTDIVDGTSSWAAIDGLPTLLNNSLISEDQGINPVLDTEIYSNNDGKMETLEEIEQREVLSFPLEVPSKGLVTTNGLFLSNDILLQFNLKEDETNGQEISEEQQDPNILSTSFKQENEEVLPTVNIQSTENVEPQEKDEEIIQLLNHDGTVISISKLLLTPAVQEIDHQNNVSNDMSQMVHEMYDVIAAQKCLKCNFLCENKIDMIKHILDNHIQQALAEKQEAEKKRKIILVKQQKAKLKNGVAPMKSLLNVNNKKPTNNIQTIYMCSVCSTTCSSTEELRKHMIDAHKLTTTVERNDEPSPEDSNNAITTKTLHQNIVQSQEKAKKIKCSVKGCMARFVQDSVRLRHEKCHVDGQKKKFKCSVCNKVFSIWRICSLHIWKCHKIDVGLYSCPMCNNYKTLSSYNLLNHLATHASDHPFVCSYCGKKFKQMSQLRNHQITHKEHQDDLPTWASQQKCDQCGNFFSCSKTLKKHIQQVHNKFKPFICNICGHNTTRKSMLQLHLRQHTGEKPHKCSVCPYSTGDHNSLRRHLMRHNGDNKYECPYCDYKCIQSSSFKGHLSKKHPGMGGTYTCLLCSFQSINEFAYKCHIQEHEKEKQTSEAESKIQKTDQQSLLNHNLSNDDDETQNYFLTSHHSDDAIDTGGITIPADCDAQMLQ